MLDYDVDTVWFSMSGDINVDDHDVYTVWFSMSGNIDKKLLSSITIAS